MAELFQKKQEAAVGNIINSDLEVVSTSGQKVNWRGIVETGKMIGAGAYGRVYVKGNVAVKVGRISEREINMGLEASELGIGPKILGYSRGEGLYQGVIIMERIRGVTMGEFEEGDKIYSRDMKSKVAQSLYENQKTMHLAGIAHRDLHEQNMIVSPNGKVTFIDFAFAEKDYSYSFYEAHDLAHQNIYRTSGSEEVAGFRAKVRKIARNRGKMAGEGIYPGVEQDEQDLKEMYSADSPVG
jgi:predicted Ser/Thr protein kinase